MARAKKILVKLLTAKKNFVTNSTQLKINRTADEKDVKIIIRNVFRLNRMLSGIERQIKLYKEKALKCS